MTEFEDRLAQLIIPPWTIPGARFRYFKTVYHIRGIIDGQVVMRKWRFTKRRWVYEVEGPIWFEINKQHIRIMKNESIDENPKGIVTDHTSSQDAN